MNLFCDPLCYKKLYSLHCVKSVRIRRYSGPYFSAFGLNTERYGLSLRIQSKCRKMGTRITPNMDFFYAVLVKVLTIFQLKVRLKNTGYQEWIFERFFSILIESNMPLIITAFPYQQQRIYCSDFALFFAL